MKALYLLTCLFFLIASTAQGRVVYHGKQVRQLPWQESEIRPLAKTGALPDHFWPHPVGVRPMLALLVDFSDAPADFSMAAVDSLLNAPGYKRFGNKGSVRDFYLDVTGGKLDIHYLVKGYYRALKTKTYYETKGNYAGGDELLDEVLLAFDKDVDYSTLGTPGESAANSVAILYAGDEHDGDLWGTTSGSDLKLDGKRIGRAFWAGLGKSSMILSTNCHEMGHMLFNWPDLYNAPTATGGVGAHCLMSSYADEYNPPPPDEALSADQGWIQVKDLQASSQGLFTAPANSDTVYRFLNPLRSNESFFVVNRKNTGRYSSLDGKGILIFHFDMSWNENQDDAKVAVLLVAEKGKLAPPKNWAEPAHYFYRENQPEFSAAMQQTGNAWHDGTASGIRLYDIGPIGDNMVFSMGSISTSARGLPLAAAAGRRAARSPAYFLANGTFVGNASSPKSRSFALHSGMDW
ncbi:MAG: hypothetical protein JWO30_3626 [Fibrobacteres bacterium]|nr:hypothetical protein [Fibrobacterota bacterium]